MHQPGPIFPANPRLITFDFGDTLVSSEPTYLERIAIGLTDLGEARTIEEVKTAYFKADLAAARELIPNSPFTPEDFRDLFSSNFFHALGLLDRASELGPPLTEFLVEFRPKRVMVPGAKELLEGLNDRGYPLGLISNNDGRTREKCRSVGIEEYFLFILDSTQEGVMKPDPRIFLKALATANVRSDQVIHVGDLWGCDVLGARNAGMPAVWLGNDLIRPEPVPCTKRIEHPLELLDLVDV